MDYSRMGGVKPTYGKNKPRTKNDARAKERAADKAALLERMKKAAEARKAAAPEQKG